MQGLFQLKRIKNKLKLKANTRIIEIFFLERNLETVSSKGDSSEFSKDLK
jgi:hypothetical protein